MSCVIVEKAFDRYATAMASTMIRLVALVALVLMPLGMAGAPALAVPADHGAASAGHGLDSTGHCDEQPARDPPPAPQMDCAAMCTALPATDNPATPSPLKPIAPRRIAAGVPFGGVVPEIATPPPKRG